MKMASSRGLMLSILLLGSSSIHRSLFNSALANFSATAGSSLRICDHFLGKRRQTYCSYNEYFENEVDHQNKLKNLKRLVSPCPSHLLTASEFAAAIGFFPRCRELLWLQKITGTNEPLADAMWLDTSMTISYKDHAFDFFMDEYHKLAPYVIPCPTVQVYDKDPFYSWMAASVDGLIDNSRYSGFDSGYPTTILKIVCIYNFDLSSDAASVEMKHVCFPNELVSGVWKRLPLYFIPQLQGILEVMGIEEMRFYAWSSSGSVSFSMFRDVEYCNVLKTVLSDFWWKHVFPAKQLCTKHKLDDPHHELRFLKPAPRHELYNHILQESKRLADQFERFV